MWTALLSWRKAAEQVDELSRGLIELGVRKGTVVQLQLPNRREFLLLVLAIERIGAVVNPIAPIFRSNEVTVMSALARPSIVITVDNFRGFNLAEMHVTLQEQSPWVDHVIVIDTMGEAIPADALEYDRLLAVGRQSTIDDRTLALLRPDPNDVCEIIFTSGTTGQPKGVMHNQNTLNVAAELWLERVRRRLRRIPYGIHPRPSNGLSLRGTSADSRWRDNRVPASLGSG